MGTLEATTQRRNSRIAQFAHVQSLPLAKERAASSAASMPSTPGAVPCADSFLPPPRPPHGSNAAVTHSFAASPSTSLGTLAKHDNLSPLTSAEKARNAIVGADLPSSFISPCAALPSRPASSSSTMNDSPAAIAASAASKAALVARILIAFAAALAAAAACLLRPSSWARSSTLTCAEMTAASKRSLKSLSAAFSGFICASSAWNASP
mmetsp:Transcript_24533/g.74823  ORF Transcript_24533/g.74823 Transcript_24533/m.74823 type:complete len:209 (-) Transcript_24533:922-1548(-)